MLDKKTDILSAFKCQSSGNCCRAEGYVYVSKVEIKTMADTLDLSVFEFREKYVIQDNGWDVIATPRYRKNCFLNDKNQCQIYHARPKECRTYPDWPEIWQSEDTLVKESMSCPGLRTAIAFVKSKT